MGLMAVAQLPGRIFGRAITLTFDQFKYGWANALDEKDAKELYDTFHIADSGIALVQMGNANLNLWTEAKVNTKNPDRGPLLIIDGEKDHTVPWAIANDAYKRQSRNQVVTEIVRSRTEVTPSPSTTAGARSPRRPSTSSTGSCPRATDLDAPPAPRQLAPRNQRHEALKAIACDRPA